MLTPTLSAVTIWVKIWVTIGVEAWRGEGADDVRLEESRPGRAEAEDSRPSHLSPKPLSSNQSKPLQLTNQAPVTTATLAANWQIAARRKVRRRTKPQ